MTDKVNTQIAKAAQGSASEQQATNAVAGAGTGSTPCAQRTFPAPTCTGDATIFSGASLRMSKHAAVMSATASIVPTSWKWISETGMPCAWLSASAMSLYTAITSARTASSNGRCPMICSISAMLLWW